MAAREAGGEYLVLLNNDTEIITQDWIESMLGLAQLRQVGAVGVKLLYTNNKTQHAGVVLGIGLVNRVLDAIEIEYQEMEKELSEKKFRAWVDENRDMFVWYKANKDYQ